MTDLSTRFDTRTPAQIARDTGKLFDISFNAMQVARWRYPFDQTAKYAFFREHRVRLMRKAGLPLLEQDLIALTPVRTAA